MRRPDLDRLAGLEQYVGGTFEDTYEKTGSIAKLWIEQLFGVLTLHIISEDNSACFWPFEGKPRGTGGVLRFNGAYPSDSLSPLASVSIHKPEGKE